jgi:hypothetical protein
MTETCSVEQCFNKLTDFVEQRIYQLFLEKLRLLRLMDTFIKFTSFSVITAGKDRACNICEKIFCRRNCITIDHRRGQKAGIKTDIREKGCGDVDCIDSNSGLLR